MPTPTKDSNSTSTLDYAAKLREAMNESVADAPAAREEDHIFSVEDDVARLLREQLALFGRTPAAESREESLWNTEDFEAEAETEADDAFSSDDLLDEGVLRAEEALQEEQEKQDKKYRKEEKPLKEPEEPEALESSEEPEALESSEEPEAPEALEEPEEPEASEDIEDFVDVAQQLALEVPETRVVLPAETPMPDTSGWQGVDDLISEEELRRDAEDGDVDLFEYLREIEGWESGSRQEMPQQEESSVPQQETRAWNVMVDETYRATDDEINGRTLEETFSGSMLSQLDEETKASLRRLGVVKDEETVQLDLFSEEQDRFEQVLDDRPSIIPEESSLLVDAQDTEEDLCAVETAWKDPLQLTLDEYQRTRRAPISEGTQIPSSVTENLTKAQDRYVVTSASETGRHDTEMYVNLGYEADISRTGDAVSIGEISEASERQDVLLGGESDTRNTEPVAYRGEEYTSSTQNCTIERAYQKVGMRNRVHLWVTLALALCGLAYDLLPDLATYIGSPLTDYVRSRAYPAYGILLLWLGMMPCLLKLWRGIRSLWEIKPVIYALPATALVITLLETAVACLTPQSGIRLYVGGALLLVFLASLTDCFRSAAEQISFHVVSSGKATYVLAGEPLPEEGAEDSESNEYIHRFRVRKVAKMSDYFLWATRYHKQQSKVGVMIPVAFLGAILVGGGVVVFTRGDFAQGLSALVGAYLLALPGCYMVSMTLPLLWANRIIGHHGSTVISPQAAEVYAPTRGMTAEAIPDSVKLSFMAADVIGAGSIKEITVKGNHDTDEYRKMARRLFALIGSPLAGEDNKLRAQDLKDIHLEISEADETCLRLYMVDHQRERSCEILMGTHEALLRRGIRLPREHMEESYKNTKDSRVIYLAFDRKFRLAYAAKYLPRRSFAGTVPVLDGLGHVLSVVSYDPLVTEDILTPACPADVPDIQLIRPDHIHTERERRSCGIAATGRAVDVTYPLQACRRIRKAEFAGLYLACMLIALAVGVCSVLLWTGIMTHVSTLLVWLWQFCWAGGAALTVRYHIRSKTLTLTSHGNVVGTKK